MDLTLTVIAPTHGGRIGQKRIAALRTALAHGGARLGPTVWLDRDRACEISLTGAARRSVEEVARQALQGASVDVGVQPTTERRKHLLVADMESTIIAEELVDEIGRRAGLGERIAAVTARAMRGEIDFAQSLRNRVALLEGVEIEMLDRIAGVITINPGATTLVKTMKAHGAYTVLVSGGFDFFASRVGKACGFDEFRANRLEIANGRLTGRVEEPILDREGKRRVLEEIAARRSLSLSDTAAIGDGANDIAMLQAAGLGVAFHGKPAVAQAAPFRLDYADLTGLLYLQGYEHGEFRD